MWPMTFAHTSHTLQSKKLQPLDVNYFKPLKTTLARWVDKALHQLL